MVELPLVKIASVAASISDTHPRSKDQLVFLNTSDVLLGSVLHRQYTPVKAWPGQAKKSIKKDDILFSEIRPANGRWAFIDFDSRDFVVSTKLMVIRAKQDKILPRFLYHFLTSAKTTNWLQHLAESRSGTFPQITFDQVAELEIALPSLSTQALIASMLDVIDDKIDINRRMSETLEGMARAIFKDWFVNFGPTRAKLKGHTPYLAPDIWALFPERLDAEETPEGWVFETIADIARRTGGEIRTGPFGSQLHQSDYLPVGTPVVMPANLTSGSIVEEGIARIGPLEVARLSAHQLRVGDIIYGRRGDIGRKALVAEHEAGWLCGTGCLRIRIGAPDCPPEYLFSYLDLPQVRDWIATRAIGATMPNLNTSILGEVAILLPGERLCAEYLRIVQPLNDRIKHCQQQNRTLVALRDLLLPRLMSGELRVVDAEKIVEAA